MPWTRFPYGGTDRLTHVEDGLENASTRIGIEAVSRGATFDGTTDDVIKLNDAAADAVAAGLPLIFPAGKTAIIGSGWTPGAITVLGNGATLKKTPNFPAADMINVGSTALSGLTIYDLIFDGNRGTDDVWTLTITGGTPSSGSYKHTFGGGSTVTIPWNATARQIQVALAEIAGESPDLTYTNVLVEGGPLPSAAVTITFIGSLGASAPGTLGFSTNTLNNSATPTLIHSTTGVSNQSNVVEMVRVGNGATRIKFVRCQFNNNRGTGVRTTGTGTKAEFYDCAADGNNANINGSVNSNGVGFYVDAGSQGKFYRCQSSNNDQQGFFVQVGAAEGCYVDGFSYRDNKGLQISTNDNGTIGHFVARESKSFGLHGTLSNYWDFGRVQVIDQGYTSGLPSGAGIELNGCSYNKGFLSARRCNGYGLALAGQGAASATGLTSGITVGTPSLWNELTFMLEDSNPSNTSDPGLHLSGGAQFNTVNAIISGAGYAVVIGESFLPYDNAFNTINLISANGCFYGAVKIDIGYSNRVIGPTARDTGTAPGLSNAVSGVVSLLGGSYLGNITNGSTSLGSVVIPDSLGVSGKDGWTLKAFMAVKVAGAGVAAADLYTYITAEGASNVTLNTAASTTVTGAVVTPMCVKGDIANGNATVSNVTPTTNYFRKGMWVKVKDGVSAGTDLFTTLSAAPGTTTFTLATAPTNTVSATEITALVTADNYVGTLESSNSGLSTYQGSAITDPKYGVYFDPLAYLNRVDVRKVRNFTTALSKNDSPAAHTNTVVVV